MKYRVVMVTDYRQDHPDETYYIVESSILGLFWKPVYAIRPPNRNPFEQRFCTHEQAKQHIEERIRNTRRVKQVRTVWDKVYNDHE